MLELICFPTCRTSARVMETKATNASSQYNTVAGKKPTAAKNPAVVFAVDRVSADGAIHSTGQVPSVPNGAQHAVSSTGSGKPSFHGGSEGWETVRRIFNPHRGRSSWLKLDASSKSLQEYPFNVAFFSRLKPILPYVQFQRSLQLTALCTSSGIWLFSCPATKEKQQYPVQHCQVARLDDWASSALCCCLHEGQGLHSVTWSNISAWKTAQQRASINSSEAWDTQE